MKNKSNKIDLFIINLKNQFEERLISVIGYGSFFQQKKHNIDDIDLVIILSTERKNDLVKIKQAFLKSKLAHPLQSQILYQDKILADGIFYSINTCGPFFLETIKNGQTLYGKNILKKIKISDQLFIKLSLLQKIQQYNYLLKIFYLNLGKSCKEKDVARFINKKINCLLLDLDWFFKQKKHFNKVLNNQEKKFLKNFKPTFGNLEKNLLQTTTISQKIMDAMINDIGKKYKASFLIKNKKR